MQQNRESFSTINIPTGSRVRLWNDYGSETLSNMTVDPERGADFVASIERIRFDNIGLVKMATTPASAQSNGCAGSLWAANDLDSLLLLIPERGTSIFEQNGRSQELSPGNIAIRDLTRPWLHRCSRPMEVTMIKVPFSLVAGRISDIDALFDASYSMAEPSTALCVNILRSINHALGGEPHELAREEISELIVNALLLLAPKPASHDPGILRVQDRAAIRRKALSYILRNIGEPDLSVTDVAENIRVPLRTLQRAFSDTGKTIRQLILTQRLDRAAQELMRAKNKGAGSILRVAFDVGFNDLSHFSRSFSLRFGVSPRQYEGTPPLQGG